MTTVYHLTGNGHRDSVFKVRAFIHLRHLVSGFQVLSLPITSCLLHADMALCAQPPWPRRPLQHLPLHHHPGGGRGQWWHASMEVRVRLPGTLIQLPLPCDRFVPALLWGGGGGEGGEGGIWGLCTTSECLWLQDCSQTLSLNKTQFWTISAKMVFTAQKKWWI